MSESDYQDGDLPADEGADEGQAGSADSSGEPQPEANGVVAEFAEDADAEAVEDDPVAGSKG